MAKTNPPSSHTPLSRRKPHGHVPDQGIAKRGGGLNPLCQQAPTTPPSPGVFTFGLPKVAPKRVQNWGVKKTKKKKKASGEMLFWPKLRG
eukprot:NODE_4744_length_556_cov_15.378698_g3462_i0.p1 GENE.NODE_4744_length_556_cov_15.378698_g3462_i0~~NODE_4744_length_556_cov_15.378698_g3462_i0.p1  ORF type:complete len:90 (-),score=7.72 NODE_4744_length_556_cov_15.378698_g3462_i0:192-461(-)